MFLLVSFPGMQICQVILEIARFLGIMHQTGVTFIITIFVVVAFGGLLMSDVISCL